MEEKAKKIKRTLKNDMLEAARAVRFAAYNAEEVWENNNDEFYYILCQKLLIKAEEIEELLVDELP